MIDCRHTLRLFSDVGYWQIFIYEAVSCEARANFVKVRGGAAMDRLTGPPVMAHVSVNHSEIIGTVSCCYIYITNTSRTSPEGQEDPIWDSKQSTALRKTRSSTYVLEPRSLDFSVQIGPFKHLVSSHTCEDKYKFPQSLPYLCKCRTLELHRLIQMASERHYLGIVMLIHESSKEGTSRCANSVADCNSGLSECRNVGTEISY